MLGYRPIQQCVTCARQAAICGTKSHGHPRIGGHKADLKSFNLKLTQWSTDKGSSALRLNFNGRPWLRWQLKNGRLLTFFQISEEHDVTVGEFQRIVMGGDLVFIDLPKDRCLMLDGMMPWPKANGYPPDPVRKR
jgi:hypothetical protein